jgi:hypothetical protein
MDEGVHSPIPPYGDEGVWTSSRLQEVRNRGSTAFQIQEIQTGDGRIRLEFRLSMSRTESVVVEWDSVTRTPVRMTDTPKGVGGQELFIAWANITP